MNTFFVDADDMEFDGENFFGKKARAKRRRKKQLRAKGLSRKEARKQARKELKKGIIKPIKRKEELVVSLPKPARREAQQKVNALKRAGVPNVAVREETQEVVGVTADGREVDVTPTGTIRPTTRMADAVASGDILVEELATTTTEDFGTEDGKKKPNFLLIGGIALVVAVGGYFLLRK